MKLMSMQILGTTAVEVTVIYTKRCRLGRCPKAGYYCLVRRQRYASKIFPLVAPVEGRSRGWYIHHVAYGSHPACKAGGLFMRSLGFIT